MRVDRRLPGGLVGLTPVLAERVNWGVVWLDVDHFLATWQGIGVTAYRLVSSDGNMVAIVTLPNPTAASEPPYELSGPLYAYFLGE